MKALEDAERARMELEDEYARVRANLLEELSIVKAERDAFREKCEVSDCKTNGMLMVAEWMVV